MFNNLAPQQITVNILLKNFVCKPASFLSQLGLLLAVSIGVAHAETKQQRAILNATNLTNFMHAVDPSRWDVAIDAIKTGKIPRIDPDQPVWIMESVNGQILYYQGDENFEGQPASKLVDDRGYRFGSKALTEAANSRPTWLAIELNGHTYSAYCHPRIPTVVCSLIP